MGNNNINDNKPSKMKAYRNMPPIQWKSSWFLLLCDSFQFHYEFTIIKCEDRVCSFELKSIQSFKRIKSICSNNRIAKFFCRELLPFCFLAIFSNTFSPPQNGVENWKLIPLNRWNHGIEANSKKISHKIRLRNVNSFVYFDTQ